jgi:hypothetical protein
VLEHISDTFNPGGMIDLVPVFKVFETPSQVSVKEELFFIKVQIGLIIKILRRAVNTAL